jgi:GNAT superfamily N-acetyltransferase
MSTHRRRNLRLQITPLTAAAWPELEALFGPRGACAGCWCMWWRIPRAQWQRQKGEGNRAAFRRIVEGGAVSGLLASFEGRAVGWCAIAPRSDYPVLARSRILKPIDDEPVWSVTCFFVAPGWRRRGVTAALLDAAVGFARRNGARIVEGYPVDPAKDQPDPFVFTGLASAFRRAGFTEALRRSPRRPIMRRLTRPASDRPRST